METVVYILLWLTSIVGLTFIIERGIALRWSKVLPRKVEQAVEECWKPDDLPKLRHACQQVSSPLSRLLLVAADHLHWPKVEAEDAVQTRRGMKLSGLSAGLSCWKSSSASRRCWDWWERSWA